MPKKTPLFDHKIQAFREALAQVDALPQLSFLAVIVGIFTSLIIVAFRLAIESPHLFLPMSSAENFESLPVSFRTALILSGTAVIAFALHNLNKHQRHMSVSHVIDRLHNHQGQLPGTNTVAQFLLATVAVSSGHCVGREGPAIHLGAGASSKMGSWLKLPNNSMQTVIACGVASAISASFDTPLAGVIFAMEVIVMEYTIVGFVPVILASVIGAVVCKSILGTSVVFSVEVGSINNLFEMGFIVVAGLVIAVFAGVFIKLNLFALKLSTFPIVLRVFAAGGLTAAVSAFVPEIMGLGYDTIQATLNGTVLASAVMLIALSKLLVTPVVVALGIPGGLIGPSLFIGACCGYVFGVIAQLLFPDLSVNLNMYVLLGMTGMMAAVINAPLAALVAILELSSTTNIIFPAMLIIVVACLTTRRVFKVRGIFIEQLALSGRDLEIGPAARALRRAGVLSLMSRDFVMTDESVSKETASHHLTNQPQWMVFPHEGRLFALRASDIAHFLDNLPESFEPEDDIHLSDIPGRRYMLQPVQESDSLYDALLKIRKTSCQVLYVTSNAVSHRRVHGIVTLEAIQNHYQPKEMSHVMG